MKIVGTKILVLGKVQGVFFRKSTVEKAVSLSIKGWVKNTPEGSVEIAAEGDNTKVNELIKWCKLGPKNAVVTGVEARIVQLSNYSDFRIIR